MYALYMEKYGSFSFRVIVFFSPRFDLLSQISLFYVKGKKAERNSRTSTSFEMLSEKLRYKEPKSESSPLQIKTPRAWIFLCGFLYLSIMSLLTYATLACYDLCYCSHFLFLLQFGGFNLVKHKNCSIAVLKLSCAFAP